MKKKLSVFIFLFVISYGIIFQFFGTEGELHGVAAEAVKPDSYSGIMDGSWQSNMASYIDQEMKLRSWMIPLRNQFVYSVFNTSTNADVVLGKDHILFEERYLTAETQITPPADDTYMNELGNKLQLLKDKLQEKRIHLIVFITPSKAHIYPEAIPDLYLELSPEEKSTSSYEKLLNILDEKQIPYFDSIPYVFDLKETAAYPVYTKTGVHWSRVAAAIIASKLMHQMEEEFSINLPDMVVEPILHTEALEPDRDLEELLNIWKGQNLDYYVPSVTFSDEEKDSISLMARGGSFMQTSVFTLASLGGVDSYYYMENTLLVDDGEISSFSGYEELDIQTELKNTDILLLEVNQEAIDRMSFGFIDYLLDSILIQ